MGNRTGGSLRHRGVPGDRGWTGVKLTGILNPDHAGKAPAGWPFHDAAEFTRSSDRRGRLADGRMKAPLLDAREALGARDQLRPLFRL